jgi:anaerobic selenocysteine-containing dehydrogenase
MLKEQLKKGKIPGSITGIEVKKSICSICNPHSHCGLDLYIKDGEIVKVEGMLEHKNSRGTLCSKGASTRQYVYHPDRIKTPLKRVGPKGSDEFAEISWEEAYSIIAEKFNRLKKEEGPEKAAFFVGYTKWMRPFVQRLAHTYGTPNYCSESSTCFKAMAMAWKLNYGAPVMPDIGNTNCLLVWSSNPMYTNTTQAEILLDKKDGGMKMIVVDPRKTPLANLADIHLQLLPGTDGALALAMGNVIINEELYDKEFVENHFHGFEEYKAYVQEFSPERAEEITKVPKEKIIEAARLYSTVKPAAFMPSASPVVHHTNGVQNYRAAMLLVGLTGNFDVMGGNLVKGSLRLESPSGFPTINQEYITPKPWSEMKERIGERELPIWKELTDEAQAVLLPKQILSGEPYPITHLLAFGINHRMWPDSENMLNALKKLEFFVATDIFFTDTCKYADIVLPVCTSVERSELKSYNNGYIIYTQPAIKPLFESKSDADVIFELAKRLDIDDDLMQKGYEANIDWIIKPSGMTVEELKKHPTGTMAPKEPVRYKKYLTEGFHTPSGKAEFTSELLRRYQNDYGFDPLPVYKPSDSSAAAMPELAAEYPFIINTGSRLPMYVHSRTFRLPWTKSLRPDSSADINKEDADRLQIEQGDDIILSTPKGSVKVKANISEMILPGVVSICHGYTDADVNTLIEAYYMDPISGFPGFKAFLGNIEKAGK